MPISPQGPDGSDRCLIVGVGASAGGLAAFKTLLAHMPVNSGMAFVLVQHLDPQHKSMLVELLRPLTIMPVVEANDGTVVTEDHVFVIPPNATLTIQNGILGVEKPAPARQHRRPIDTFFCSLAEDQRERAVAIVLSGVGTDGSHGVRCIKEHGGIALAQAEFDHEAQHGMPLSAASTGLIDHIIPIDAMPEKLAAYQRYLKEIPAEDRDDDGVRKNTRDNLVQITTLLRSRTGHDFQGYKETTFARRIQRRMQVLQLESVGTYIEVLSSKPEEIDLLFADLLIGVTQFFRDPEAFEALDRKVISKLMADRGVDDQIRIWVPGCATGEEAYSIAMLIREASGHGVAGKVVIFGTDIDPSAIATARAGHYSAQPHGVSDERFERWFTQDRDYFCPIREIRELCVFSVHSVIKDPPFSRLDLISCRNLLIYLNSDVQHRVMETFHYALKPQGHLFLGPSESTTRDARLFTVVDKKHRILKRSDVGASLPRLSPTLADRSAMTTEQAGANVDDAIDKRARRALETFSPAYFVIDANNEIIRFSGSETRHFLEPSSGAASLNLFVVLSKRLRQSVRAAVQDARNQRRRVVRPNLSFIIDGRARSVTLIAEPIGDNRAAGVCVVAFSDIASADHIAHEAMPTQADDANDHALEQELRETKSLLLDAINDLELQIEENKSTTEEFQSVNEELQSSNEELETAKEEMQSINEELQTINAELFSKNELLTRLNSDMQNLMDSTEIAIVFLDQNLRIKSFTPAIGEIFPLQAGDRGRPLGDIVSRLIDADLTADLATVQRSLATVEREMQINRDGELWTLLMRVRPYRTVDNRIDGVVVTFVDINALTQVNIERARFAAVARASGDALIGLSLDGVVSSWSPGAEALLGYSAAEMIGQNISHVTPDAKMTEQSEMLDRIQSGDEVFPFDTVRKHKDGREVHVSLRAAPIFSAQGAPVGISSTWRDISARKKSEQLEILLNRELSHRVKNSLAVIQSIAHHTLRSTPEPQKFTVAFQGRLRSLAFAHEILTQANWSGAEFEALARQQLAPFLSDDTSRVKFDGEVVLITPDAATTLGLVLHELATNASKYGSLSVPGGTVSLTWRLKLDSSPPRLHITWQEAGGPPVKAPGQHGFGSQLIQRSGLVVEQRFEKTGFFCCIEVPLYDKPPAKTEWRD